MKVLVIGSGGREHALVWKLSQSPEVRSIFAAPGNGGISDLAETVDIGAEDVDALAEFAETKDIDLTIVGPEAPLAKGIVDIFEKRGLRIFGPSKAASRLESSKAFAKNIMKKYRVPTSQFAVFDDAQAARAYVRQLGAPIVIKADGLCGGKGTIVANTLSEALGAIDLLMEDRIFKQAGERIVVEERLYGEEVSIIVLTDGTTAVPLLASQDHKRVLDGDKGWRNFGETGMELDAGGVANQKRTVYLQVIPTTLLPLKGKDFQVEGAGDEKVGDADAVVIKVTAPDGKDFKLYFDKTSGLVVKQVAKVVSFMGDEFTQETTYGNYKDFGGIKKATKIESTRDSEKLLEAEITDFELLDEVDPKTFAEPK